MVGTVGYYTKGSAEVRVALNLMQSVCVWQSHFAFGEAKFSFAELSKRFALRINLLS